MPRGSERRRRALQNSRRFAEERRRLAREKFDLSSDAAPLPGEQGPAAHTADGAAEPPPYAEIGQAPGQLPESSPFESTGPTRFRVYRFDDTACTKAEFSDIDRLPAFADGRDTVWVQVLGITDPQVVHIVGAIFRVPMLMQEDILSVVSRPKLDEEGDIMLAITRSVRLSIDEEGPRGQQVSVVAGPGFVISFQENDEAVFAGVEKRLGEGSGRIRKSGPGYLFYALLDTLVDRMLYLSEQIEDVISELEDSVLVDGEGCSLQEIYRVKRVIVRLSRIVIPMRDTLGGLQLRDHPLLPDAIDPFLNDLQDHCLRAADRVEHARMILQDLQEYHHTLHERKTNEIIRLLTVVSSVFIPLTFIAGVYGMNFDHMPELRTRFGYFVCLGVMALFTTGTLLWFRKKRWL